MFRVSKKCNCSGIAIKNDKQNESFYFSAYPHAVAKFKELYKDTLKNIDSVNYDDKFTYFDLEDCTAQITNRIGIQYYFSLTTL